MLSSMLRLSLILTTPPDTMDLDTSDMPDSDTLDTDTDSDTTARGLLMLRLSLILTTPLDTMDLDTSDTDTGSDTTARGLLMLRPIPTFFMEDTLDTRDTSDMPDTLDTDTEDTTSANRLNQDLSVNHRLNFRQKWIIISLKFPSPVLQFQCYHNLSLMMVSRKQENPSGKNPTNTKITKKK